MHLKDIGFEQLLSIVKQLPDEKRSAIKKALKTIEAKTQQNAQENAFNKLLLQGPVMDQKQFKNFKANRDRFDLWRKK